MDSKEFQTIPGKKEILISAPHAHPHKRPSLTCAYKTAEPWTDLIAMKTCSNLSSFGIILCNESDYDPNYNKVLRNPYKRRVKEIINENTIKTFIDLHGQRDDHGFDIGIYYPTRFRRSAKLAQSIANGINRGKLKGVSIYLFRFLDNQQETLGEYVASKLRVPSVQIEIAKYIREDDSLREEFIKNLSQVLLEEKI